MMTRRILTICAAVAAGTAWASFAHAQNYPAQSYPVPSGAAYSPGSAAADYRRGPGAPDLDSLQDDGEPQGSTALSPPGPVLSPDDPRYGRPMGAPVYSDRGAPAGPVLSPDDPRYGRPMGAPVYSDRSAPAGPVLSPDDPRYGRPMGAPVYSDRSAPTGPILSPDDPRYAHPNGPPVIYSDRDGRGPANNGLRPPGSVGGAAPAGVAGSVETPAAPVGADGKPMVMSALPPEEQPETGPAQLAPNLRRQEVAYQTKEPAGTIVVDTPHTYLYYILGGGRAIRYGVRVGRDGFTWTGVQKISRKAEWPDWHPPPEMIDRQPYLPRFMAGGPGNPLGARAMYLGSTVYRIHGTNQPSTIGKFVSSGCIGMLNEDVSDLFDRVKVGTRVVVLPGGPPPAAVASAQPVPGPNAGAPVSGQTSSVPGTQPTVVPPLPAPVTVR
ncbi:MAG: L,D-transpeptidase family protein [Bradyrhizobium sp.]|uniref:L,D-transpeptidase family protein n=1 Tax=Bradyrhizobium sp. TaxID=376 RepID=UPI001C29229A|nr:L,D-transpeptidase [Bradyrhizobium sp.]MBU6464819.1 L,D-transpeptidase family protein [Pseudomonadota bacterium]MDE2069197.1 L,D-transpeptidase family protein [Bradyrhizobium sp.]